MKYTFVDTIGTGVGHGQYLRDFSEFEEETPWADPILRIFFRYATVKNYSLYRTSAFDYLPRFLAAALVILLSPIFILIATLIKVMMPGKVFYKQTRVGQNGKLFQVLKFRTMIENAEDSTGHTLSWTGDPRITGLGGFLRKSHLDELPQLINVVKGEMFFIGPRPERPEFTAIFEETIKGYNDRHRVKPGITGLAQLACTYNATASQKLKFDLMYIAMKDSFILNTMIAIYTIKKMIFLKSTANLLR